MATKVATELEVRSAVHRLPFCGCGRPGALMEAAVAWLNECSGPATGRPGFAVTSGPLAALGELGVELLAHVLDDAGFTEHGGNVEWAWPTDAGKILVAFVEKYGPEMGDIAEPKWPTWAFSCGVGDQFALTDEEWRKLTNHFQFEWSVP